MAKRGILEHPKTLDLAERLELMAPFAVGLLECFWHWVAKYYPNGDVTGMRPALLAASIRYSGNADDLWQAMIDSGFIDAKERVLVHDWSEHADDAVRKRLKDRNEKFADGSEPYARRFKRGHDSNHNQLRDSHDVSTKNPENVVPNSCLPEPEPEPEPEQNPIAPPLATQSAAELVLVSLSPKISKRVSVPDPRFAQFKTALERYWSSENTELAMPWDGSEARRLNELLHAMPSLKLPEFERMLSNRARSDVPQSIRPRGFLGNITAYAGGPLDRYGKIICQPASSEASVGKNPDSDEDLYALVERVETLHYAEHGSVPPLAENNLESMIHAALRLAKNPTPELEERLRAYVEWLYSARKSLKEREEKSHQEVRSC